MMTNMAIDAEILEALLLIVFTAHQLMCEAGIGLANDCVPHISSYQQYTRYYPGKNDFELHFCYLLYYIRVSVVSSLLFMPLLPE